MTRHAECHYTLRRLAVLSSLAAALLGAVAHGAEAALDLNRFHPAPGSGRLLTVDLAEVGGRSPELGAQLLLHYADLPLAYSFGGKVAGELVKDRLTADLALSFAFLERLQLSLALPLTLHQAGGDFSYLDGVTGQPRSLPRVSAGGLEDMRLGLKGRLWSNERFGLGGALEVAAPTGSASNLLGSSQLAGTAHLIGHAVWSKVKLALNLGWRWAPGEQRLLNIQPGGGLLYGAGAQVEVWRQGNVPIYVLGEVYGLVHSSFASAVSSPAEAMLAGKTQVNDWTFFLGAGGGLNSGYGAPRVRLTAGVAYTWEYRPPPPKPATVDPFASAGPTASTVPPASAGSPGSPASPQPPVVTVAEDRLQLGEAVYFEFNMATINPVSYPLLDQVAEVLRKGSELGKVRIEGHTDEVGEEHYNLQLSQRRARAVYEHLIMRGVPTERLLYVGYGKRCPLVPNSTEEGRATNRRVDFILVERELHPPRPGQCPERSSLTTR